MISYNLYYEYLFCKKKAEIIKRDYKKHLHYKNNYIESRFLDELTKFFDSDEDDYQFPKGYHRKPVIEYLYSLKEAKNELSLFKVCDTLCLDNTLSNFTRADSAYFTLTIPIYSYNTVNQSLSIYVFDYTNKKLLDRKAIVSAVDFASILYHCSACFKIKPRLIKVYISTFMRNFKTSELIFDLFDSSVINYLMNNIYNIVYKISEINNSVRIAEAEPSRFNCSRCAFAYLGHCSMGAVKYFNTENLYREKN